MKRQDVIEFFGSGPKVAKFIGKTPQAVYAWPDIIDPKWALYFDEATQGQLEFDKRLYQNRYIERSRKKFDNAYRELAK